VWNHLLKVSASNSMDIVEQMIPSGSGKVAIDNILHTEEGKSVSEEKKDSPVCGNAPEKSGTDPVESQPSQYVKSPNSVSRGGKQGSWREASGPTKAGVGFKGAGRGGKSGLHCWHQMLLGKGPMAAIRPTTTPKESQINVASTTGLKAMLGVSDNNNNNNKPSNGKSSAQVSDESMGIERKASTQVSDASMGLKSILGVGQVISPAPVLTPPLPPKSASAADCLLQMMAHAPTPSDSNPQVTPQSSHPNFNFTYVTEGEAPA